MKLTRAEYADVPFGGAMQSKPAVEEGAVPLLGEGELKHESSSRLGWRRICCAFLQSLAVAVLLHVVFCITKHCHHGQACARIINYRRILPRLVVLTILITKKKSMAMRWLRHHPNPTMDLQDPFRGIRLKE